ncbi:MAG: hypothetical protein ACYTFY_10850 [Planctomycetota bacterium]|jgi:hypothetical protein
MIGKRLFHIYAALILAVFLSINHLYAGFGEDVANAKLFEKHGINSPVEISKNLWLLLKNSHKAAKTQRKLILVIINILFLFAQFA